MNNLRLEVKVSVIVYAGADVSHTDGPAPARDPDTVETVRLVRLSELGTHVAARDAAAGLLVNILANSAPVLAERLRHNLRTKVSA